MIKYGKVTNEFVKKLEDVACAENVYSEIFDLIPYCRDNCVYRWSKKFDLRPDVVVTPENTAQVSEIARLANEEKIPVTPKGGGTGMAAGCVPKYGGIVLDMKKMDKILEVNEEDMYVVVQPGVVNESLIRELGRKGYVGAHEPGSSPSSVIGGSISTRGVNYRQGVIGAMIDMVIGLEAVLASGEVIRMGIGSGSPRLSSSSSALDLVHLFVGDYGTLGIKTEATLKIYPKPEREEIHVVVFPSLKNTIKAIQKIQRSGLPGIFTYTFFDEHYMKKSVTIYGGEVYGGAVLIGFWGDPYIVDYVRDRATKIWKEFGGEDLGPEEAAEEWANRYDVYPKMIGTVKPAARWHYEDPTTPLSKAPEILDKWHQIVAKYGFEDWGGEGWVYDATTTLLAIMYGWDETKEEQWDNYMKCADEIVRYAVERGASITQCLGYDKRGERHKIELLKKEFGPALDTMKMIKKALDPNEIMNPGVMGFDVV